MTLFSYAMEPTGTDIASEPFSMLIYRRGDCVNPITDEKPVGR